MRSRLRAVACSQGVMWSEDQRQAWRIVDDGLEVSEISMEDARAIATKLGEASPARTWRGYGRTV